MEIAGQIVSGEVAEILIRQKSGETIELGDLLVVEDVEHFLILQVFDLRYGSQVSGSARELLAGMKLEGFGTGLEFLEPELRNYVIAAVKAVARISNSGNDIKIPKVLPRFFSSVRRIKEDDLKFLTKPSNPVYLGKIRSGSKVLDFDVFLDGEQMFVHHVLVPATTGRGKSNLLKIMLWSVLNESKFGILVLDAHDEYYGRKGKGLKDHPQAAKNLKYFTINPPTGTNTLVINLRSLRPEHFEGLVNLSDQQHQAIKLYYDQFKENWIENIVRGTEVERVASATLSVLQRIMRVNLSVFVEDGELVCRNRVFDNTSGEATISSIVEALESGKVVIVDTSKISDEAELLIGSSIANQIFFRHQEAKATGELDGKRPVSIIIEEAPRVLSAERLAESGNNIYTKIAREGRKFKVGLVAITQLTSVIPKEILTNINTKIILGNEMATERKAIIESAAQDLSEDDRNIASLDRGEAIVSSIFTKFAVPLQIPLFDDYAKEVKSAKEKVVFTG